MAARQSNWLKKPIDLPAERLLRSCAPWPPLTQRTASSTKLSKQVDKVHGSPSDSATLPWPKQFTMSSVFMSSICRTAILELELANRGAFCRIRLLQDSLNRQTAACAFEGSHR